MTLEARYGATPINEEEAVALTPEVLEILEGEPCKASIYRLEQIALEETEAEWLAQVLNGEIGVDDLLRDYFVRRLHDELYGDIWQWAGKYRIRELNIGVAPEQIAESVRASLGNILYRWEFTDDWTPHDLGIAVHMELVRIHPFTDGNGRSTRLMADLTTVAAQCERGEESIVLYDWAVDRRRYIDLLMEYDRHRDPKPLSSFVKVHPL